MLATVLLLILVFHGTIRAQQQSEEQNRTDLRHIFNDHYRSYERPDQGGPPVVVDVNILITSLSDFNARTSLYEADLYLRQRWTDKRLKHNLTREKQAVSISSLRHKIWTPDLFFANARKAYKHKVTTPNLLLWVYPNGQIIFSQKLSLTLQCMMRLHKFPMDIQNCFLEISSYGHGMLDIQLKWWSVNKADTLKDKSTVGVLLAKSVELNEFKSPIPVTVENCSDFSIITGNFACLRANFTLCRQLGFYMINTYVPSSLIVATAWMSFFIDRSSAPARVSLCLLSFLTLMTQTSAILANLPPVSYIKAIDVWLFVSLAFVTFALVEYAAVSVVNNLRNNILARIKKKHDYLPGADDGTVNSVTGNPIETQETPIQDMSVVLESGDENGKLLAQATQSKEKLNSIKNAEIVKETSTSADTITKQPRKMTLCQRIDRQMLKVTVNGIETFSKIMYVILYIVFVIFYWLKYGGREEHQACY